MGVGRKIGMATSVWALVASGAMAQDAPVEPGEPVDLGVLVLGELQNRTIQDTATSVAVETGEALEQRNEPDLYDVLERTPNVSPAGQNVGVSIRGIDQRGVGGGGSSVVSIQVDGIALPSTQSTFFGPYSTFDLQQIEVLRGPQSTQQGRNALAGAIVVRSQDPTYNREGKLRLGFGSRNTKEAGLAVNTPLGDHFALRFSAEGFETDGWVENPTRNEDDFAREDAKTARVKLRWDPSDVFTAIASYTYSENFGAWASVDDAFYPDEERNFSDGDFRHGSTHYILGLRTEWEVNSNWTLETETTGYEQDYLRNSDGDYSPAPLNEFRRRGGSEAFEQDVRLRFDYGGTRGVLGLFYSKTDADNPTVTDTDASFFNTQLAAAGVPAIAGFQVGEATLVQDRLFGNASENFALFGEVDYDVPQVDGLTLTLGARYDRERIELTRRENYDLQGFNDYLTRIGGFLPPANVAFIAAAIQNEVPPDIPTTDSAREFEAFLPKFVASYDWNENLTTAFSVQRAYRAGGSNVNIATGQEYEFDPEYAWNYELSVRSEFNDGRIVANGNLFYMDWQDQQVSVQRSADPLDVEVANAGQSIVYGFEASLEAQATENLDLFAAIGFARSEFIDFETDGQDFSGNSFGEPEWTGALGGTYFFDNGVSLSADASYTGESFEGIENDPDLSFDARWLVNAEVAYEAANGLRAAIYARNLFDERYATRIDDLDDGRRFLATGEPQTFGAYLQWEF